jgi:hypothetical protein
MLHHVKNLSPEQKLTVKGLLGAMPYPRMNQ